MLKPLVFCLKLQAEQHWIGAIVFHAFTAQWSKAASLVAFVSLTRSNSPKQIDFRFPCPVANCKKEYRSQWELNSHNRSKHSKPGSAGDIEYTVKIEYNTSNEQTSSGLRGASTAMKSDRTAVSVTKRKKRNSAKQIIYVMPGPDQ